MTRRQFLIMATSAAGAFAAHSVAEAYRFRVEHVRARMPKLRAPLRVAFLCDLHYGPYVRAASVRAWVDAALEAAPELVVLGGDLVDRMAYGDPLELVAELRRLRAPLGVHAVWGNHDHRRFKDLSGFAAELTRAGITVLTNRGVSLRNDLYLAGIDDYRLGQPDLAAALRDRRAGEACLLVSHNPDLLPEVPREVELTLCGHTHGGQVRIPGVGPVLTSSAYGRRFASGWARAPALGYVSRGLGVGWLPVRVDCPAELSVVDLET